MISRRSFLVAGAGLVVSACGSSGKGGASSASTGSSTSGGFVVLKRYPNTSLTPGRVRLPLSLGTPEGALLAEGPATLAARVVDAETGGNVIAELTLERHGVEMVQPYYPLTVDIDAPGIYWVEVDDALNPPSAFQLFDPSEVKVATVGSRLEAFDTPTVDDARGVDPICTRATEPCPFHSVTLTEALASGKPVVYLIGTPAHCQIGTCAPGLEYLVDLAPQLGDRAVIVHAEVFADAAGTQYAPAVTASELDYEPVIFVTDADGVVTERIDVIWDERELDVLLERALS